MRSRLSIAPFGGPQRARCETRKIRLRGVHIPFTLLTALCLGCGGTTHLEVDATAHSASHEAGIDTSVRDGEVLDRDVAVSDGPGGNEGGSDGACRTPDGGDAAACRRDGSGVEGECCIFLADCLPSSCCGKCHTCVSDCDQK